MHGLRSMAQRSLYWYVSSRGEESPEIVVWVIVLKNEIGLELDDVLLWCSPTKGAQSGATYLCETIINN